ncbi:MAG TPA: DUF6677 family protein [Planctomycetota bacterium]|jgi:TM2 domain-containing membrane protein YozV|nr:DUF6677 family protein [Planctomycetota bacterium]
MAAAPDSAATLPSFARRSEGGRPPFPAVLLTLLVPGLGHVYAGFLLRGIAVFLFVNGLYAAGLVLGERALLGFSSLRGPLRIDLLPEVLNVGATYVAGRLYADVAYLDPGDSPHRNLGILLTALSGVFAALAASDAHFLARAGRGGARRSPAVVATLSFLVPGLGHFLLGERKKGVLLFAALTSIFVVGLLLSDGNVVDRDRHYYYWAGQILNGVPTSIAHLLFMDRRVSSFPPHLDSALLFVTAAGLLNVLVMIDAYAEAEGRMEA